MKRIRHIFCYYKITPIVLSWGILMAVIAAITLIIVIISKQHAITEERPPVEQISGVPLYVNILPEGSPGRPGTKREIKYVVIHETGNPSPTANAQAHSAYLLSGTSGETSWHYTVDDTQIYQHIPDNEVAWHAGDGLTRNGGNANGIGIELCVNEGGNFEFTLQNGAKLAAYLLHAYQLDISAVKQHYDFNEKNCPQTLRESGRWQEFLDLVSQNLKSLEELPAGQ